MIQQNTILKVSDNSGAKTVRCIRILGGFKKKIAKTGDLIVTSVQQLRNQSLTTSKVNKKEVYQALIIKTKKNHIKKNGFSLTFSENAVILINKQKNPVGTRILGPTLKSLKKKKFQKILNISSGLI
jgi:large subunit ribosomal protein L14